MNNTDNVDAVEDSRATASTTPLPQLHNFKKEKTAATMIDAEPNSQLSRKTVINRAKTRPLGSSDFG